MKTQQLPQTLFTLISLSLLSLPFHAHAAQQGIGAYTDDGSISTASNGTYGNLTSVTIGGDVYTDLTGSTASVNVDSGTGTSTIIGLWVEDGAATPVLTSRADLDPAASGLNDFSGPANIRTNSIFQFGTTIAASDQIFIFDFGTGDDATFSLINSSGTTVGDYSITLSASNFNTVNTFSQVETLRGDDTNDTVSSVKTLAGIAFQLSDFSGTTGDLSTATGIRLTANSGLDPALVGLAQIPEPGAFALLAGMLGFGLVLVRRTRR